MTQNYNDYSFIKSLFGVYTTTRLVRIKSKPLAFVYLILMLIVWAAFLRSYQLDLRKIYQKSCAAKGVSITKVKGVISTENYTNEEINTKYPNLYKRVWDTEDIAIKSDDGLFLMTNTIITSNQTRGFCISKSSKKCKNETDCAVGASNPTSNGIYNGTCSLNDEYNSKKCITSAWCPIESDILPLNGTKALLNDVRSFTILIKNSVEFPECEINPCDCDKDQFRRRNILDNYTTSYLKNCQYHPDHHPYCPIFNVGDIISRSGSDFNNVSIIGAVFRIKVTWDCDFDFGRTIKDCLPKYTFSLIGNSNETVSPGYNFRTAFYHEENRRTLVKHYGIKFIIETTGEGRKFDFLLLVLTIGASIGLFALAPLVCDLLFDLFCVLKLVGGPCEKLFGSYTEEIRYQSINAHLTQNLNNSTFQSSTAPDYEMQNK